MISKKQYKHSYIFKVLLSALLMLPGLCGFAQEKPAKDKFRLLVYGLPNFKRINAENIISKKWGIEFYPVAGCDVSKELEDSVEKYNKKVERKIKKKYGKNWSKQLDKEIDAEYAIQSALIPLLDSNTYVIQKSASLGTAPGVLQYYFTPIPNTSQYRVAIEGWGTWEGKEEWLSYYEMLVDYKTKSISLYSDKVTKL